jgi:hypothetical protein
MKKDSSLTVESRLNGTTQLSQPVRSSDVSLAQWLAFMPYELVRAHLNIDKSVLSKVLTQKTAMVGN